MTHPDEPRLENDQTTAPREVRKSGTLIAGRYRLKAAVGSGGMGVVWQATDEELEGHPVTLKPVPTDDEAVDSRQSRLRREAMTWARLDHPNVLTVFDVVETDRERWLVTEFLESLSLAEMLRQRGVLPEQEVARIGAQVASALQEAHAHKVLHRNVNPDAILVTPDGEAKLTDFGMSIWRGATQTDIDIASGAYLAPEVVNGGRSTPASDVFSLGVTLFAATEGHPPYDADATNPVELLRQVAASEMFALDRANALATVLTALLRPNPADRPSAAQAQEFLTHIAEGDTVRVLLSLPLAPMRPNPFHRVIRALRARFWRRRIRRRPTYVMFPVTIYLSDASMHRSVQAAVEGMLRSEGAEVIDRDEPIFGSWFRWMHGRIRKGTDSPLTREVARTATHALDGRLVHAQDATNTATMMQSLGPVLTSLHPIKEAVIRVGALLIVKVDESLAVHQLTAAQQLRLNHHPDLLRSPNDILRALDLTANTPSAQPASPLPVTAAQEPGARAHDAHKPLESDDRRR